MDNPVKSVSDNHDLYTLWAALVGGLLSVIGGFFAVSIRARIDKKSEISYIKVGLTDELDEICTVVDKLIETCNATHIIPNVYLNTLNDTNIAFDYHKVKLFLINNDSLRKEISSFYKEIHGIIQESRNKVGKLGEAANEEHDRIAEKFAGIKSKADALRKKLKAYNYKIFWIF